MDPQPLFLALFGLIRPEVRAASVALNDPAFFAIFSIALLLLATWRFNEWRRLPFVLTALALALLLGVGMKAFLQEPRPCMDSPGKIPCPLDFSLPSLHALMVFTLAISAVGNRSFAIYLIYALFTAFSRVYLGVHTITQVAAGLALAFFACVLAEMLWRALSLHIPEQVHIRHGAGKLQT